MNIGDTIRIARKAAGLSQEEVARRAGLSLKGMGEIERGDIEDPHISSLAKIARALGVPVEALIKEEEEAAVAGKASLSELLERAGASTRWLAAPEDQWQAELSSHNKTRAGERLLQIAREQMEELAAVMPYLFRGEDALGNPALTPATVEAWHAVALRRIKTLHALKSMLDDPEVDAAQKGSAKLLASLYEGIGRHLEKFRSQNFRIHDVVVERPIGSP